MLPNILRRKSNQKMKFGQLVEYNKRNAFFLKACRKYDRDNSSIPLFVFTLANSAYNKTNCIKL